MNPYLLNSEKVSYLLDSNLQTDSPLPVYKTFLQIFEENLYSVLILFFCILLGLLIWRILKKKKLNSEKIETTPPSDPFEDAINAITELQNQKQIEPKPFVFKLSEILRLYVERLFNFPALELTGEEFMREIVSHSFFKNRYENTLRDFVVQGDIIKYSRELVSERTTDQLLELALHFVKDTHARLVEEKKSGEEPSRLKIGNK
mgnify:FL=1